MTIGFRLTGLRRVLAAGLIGLTTLSACAPAATPTAAPPVEPTVAPTTAPTEAPTAAPTIEPTIAPPTEAPAKIVVTDALDREVVFSELPQRVVIAGRATTLVADAFFLFPEAAERLVGFEQRGQSAVKFLSVVDPTFGEKTMLEQNAAPEQIAPLKPDVVILKSAMAEKLGTPLEALGIKVVYVDLETPEQFTRDITALGQLLGNPERAQEILAFFQGRVDAVSAATAGLSDDQKPRVLLLQHSEDGGEVAFNVPPEGWIQTTLVRIAGGTPVWTEAAEAGGWTIVNFEQIAAWDPDQIYIVSYNGDSDVIAAALMDDPTWQGLRAAENRQVYGFAGDFYSWDQPDPRWVLGLDWLFTWIQPELAADVDLEQAVDAFYTELYGLDEAVVAEQVLPNLYGSMP
ncbi:MAG: ABC transporter substrate-binding protein [Anaerolineales bacterium]|nr:ABC transporter substrate-binding protein [Anaerolineales bacterium]